MCAPGPGAAAGRPGPPLSPSCSQGAVAFEDVAVHFSLEEWRQLVRWQRQLYWEVMLENRDLVASLGKDEPCTELMGPRD